MFLFGGDGEGSSARTDVTIRSVTQWKQVISMATGGYHVPHGLTSKAQRALCYRNRIYILACPVDFLPLGEHHPINISCSFLPLIPSSFILIKNRADYKECIAFDVRTALLLKGVNKRWKHESAPPCKQPREYKAQAKPESISAALLNCCTLTQRRRLSSICLISAQPRASFRWKCSTKAQWVNWLHDKWLCVSNVGSRWEWVIGHLQRSVLFRSQEPVVRMRLKEDNDSVRSLGLTFSMPWTISTT